MTHPICASALQSPATPGHRFRRRGVAAASVLAVARPSGYGPVAVAAPPESGDGR